MNEFQRGVTAAVKLANPADKSFTTSPTADSAPLQAIPLVRGKSDCHKRALLGSHPIDKALRGILIPRRLSARIQMNLQLRDLHDFYKIKNHVPRHNGVYCVSKRECDDRHLVDFLMVWKVHVFAVTIGRAETARSRGRSYIPTWSFVNRTLLSITGHSR